MDSEYSKSVKLLNYSLQALISKHRKDASIVPQVDETLCDRNGAFMSRIIKRLRLKYNNVIK